MQAVILSFDSLAASSIGCYGNDWIETPHFDRLASTGIVFDRSFTDTVGTAAGHSWITGFHSLNHSRAQCNTPIGRRLHQNNVATTFITVNETREWQQIAEFDDIRIVEGDAGIDTQPDQVPIARLVKSALPALVEPAFQSRPRLLWLHAPSPGIPPVGFDSLYFEDFEERGEYVVDLPDDVKAVHPAIYAGSVSLIDHWLGELLQAIESHSQAEPTLVIVMAAQGYLWHQHRSADATESLVSTSPLCDQNIRTPLLIRSTGDDRYQDFCSIRSTRFVQSPDLVPTLLDWFQIEPGPGGPALDGQSWLKAATETIPARTSLWIGDGMNDAVRTHEWLCIREVSRADLQETHAKDNAQFKLFSKPEDLWDVDDIASQQSDLLTELVKQFPEKSV